LPVKKRKAPNFFIIIFFEAFRIYPEGFFYENDFPFQ